MINVGDGVAEGVGSKNRDEEVLTKVGDVDSGGEVKPTAALEGNTNLPEVGTFG